MVFHDKRDVRIRYLHGRPWPHPMHGRLAEAVGAEFAYIDQAFRWQDRNPSAPFLPATWFINALFCPKRRNFSVFLIDGLHVSPAMMKHFSLIKPEQKIVAHLASHTLYFLLNNRYSRMNSRILKWALASYDAVFCEGDMTRHMVHQLLGPKAPPSYSTFLGIPAERSGLFDQPDPELDGKNIVLIAEGSQNFRAWYKGLDLAIDACVKVFPGIPDLKLNILGTWENDIKEKLLKDCPKNIRGRIVFRGRQSEVSSWLQKSALYLHTSRGDAFPVATLEAMAAGSVPLVSEWTGTKEVIQTVNPHLIVPLDVECIAERIAWYFTSDSTTRREMSRRCRDIADRYREDRAVSHYQKTFEKMMIDLGVI